MLDDADPIVRLDLIVSSIMLSVRRWNASMLESLGDTPLLCSCLLNP